MPIELSKRVTLFSFVNAVPGLAGRTWWDVAPARPSSGMYALLWELSGGVEIPLYQGHDVMSTISCVTVYALAPPGANHATLRRELAGLLRRLSSAPQQVNTDHDGIHPIVSLHRVDESPPLFDKDIGGLFMTLRFEVQRYR